jgi:hypothetical protein
MTPDILDLIEGTQDGNLGAARMLADIVAQAIQRPDRRVADAFRIEPSRDRRDRIVRDLAGGDRSGSRQRPFVTKLKGYRPHASDRAAAGERALVATRTDRFA